MTPPRGKPGVLALSWIAVFCSVVVRSFEVGNVVVVVDNVV